MHHDPDHSAREEVWLPVACAGRIPHRHVQGARVMRMTLSKTGRFEAAHWLPRVDAGHKCGRLHGHSYTVRISVAGEVDAARGWVMDLGALGAQLDQVVAHLDHKTLNEIEGLDNPTSEHLAAWIWGMLAPELPLLSEVEVAETATSSCRYVGC